MNWTEPVATDNSGVAPTVTSNYQSPQRFSQGTHDITYFAVDQSGNKATCTFTVKVAGIRVLTLSYSNNEEKVAMNISVTRMRYVFQGVATISLIWLKNLFHTTGINT